MIGSLIILLAAAAPAPATPNPVPAVPPPLKERIDIYGAWNPELVREQLASGIIRAPAENSRWDAIIPLDRFPAALRRGETETSATIELLLTVAPDDRISSCRAVSIKGHEGALREPVGAPIALDPALGENACAIVQSHGRFRHAIDGTGMARAAPLQLAVHFERQRYDRSIAPAPPPPSRWLGERPYDIGPGWPPRWTPFAVTSQVILSLPKWKAFVAGRKDLPKAATVGALIDFDNAGQVANCRIGRSSDDSGLDQATCQALATARNQTPQRFLLRNYPVEVHWKQRKATITLPRAPLPPAMVGTVLLSDADAPGAPLPARPIRMQVQLDPQGKPSSCRIASAGDSSDAFDARSCALVLERARFTGGVDVFGRGAAGGLYLEADWQKRTIAMSFGYF
jgi:hypothetical protein